jgi:hypothetical protein
MIAEMKNSDSFAVRSWMKMRTCAPSATSAAAPKIITCGSGSDRLQRYTQFRIYASISFRKLNEMSDERLSISNNRIAIKAAT